MSADPIGDQMNDAIEEFILKQMSVSPDAQAILANSFTIATIALAFHAGAAFAHRYYQTGIMEIFSEGE